MSFIITVYTNEGIIMASDSRTTYTETQMLPNKNVIQRVGIQVTDTTYKTFVCNNHVALSTCGDATINNTPIAGYIESFIVQKVDESSNVSDISKALIDFFSNFSPVPDVHFIVAGYNQADKTQQIERVFVANKQITSINVSDPGALWDGEVEILKRVVKNVSLKNDDGSFTDLPNFSIGFNFFTLQDAINFAEYAVDITIKTMSFQNCVKTVGGPIDILAIKPDRIFWIKRKELYA